MRNLAQIFYMFHYLQFWLRSTNQHGVHSPFVYNYLTKGLYPALPGTQKQEKAQLWLEKSIRYFKPETIYALDKEAKSLAGNYPAKHTASSDAAEVIVAKQTPAGQSAILNTVRHMGPRQLLLFYNNSYDAAFQKQLRDDETITLVLDFYYGSLLSRRTEQLKENFFLRL